MPQNITQYDLLISCPGDINDEIKAIESCVRKFNELNENVSIRTRHWSKSGYAQMGDSAQNLLNEQFIMDCDAVVALFWTRFGTPTDKYKSGTEEEICEMINAGKQVFLYFSDVPVSPSKIDLKQIKMIESFRLRFKNERRGLYYGYQSVTQFENIFFEHLTKYFIDLKKA